MKFKGNHPVNGLSLGRKTFNCLYVSYSVIFALRLFEAGRRELCSFHNIAVPLLTW